MKPINIRPIATAHIFLFLTACVHPGRIPDEDGSKVLFEAVDALSGRDDCKASEFSTDNMEIVSLIKRLDFRITEHSAHKEDGQLTHSFILRPTTQPTIISADILSVGGHCHEYTFGMIVD